MEGRKKKKQKLKHHRGRGPKKRIVRSTKCSSRSGFCLLSAFSLPDPALRFFLASGVERLQEAYASLTPVFLSSDYTDSYFLLNFLNHCLHLVILWLKTLSSSLLPMEIQMLSLVFSIHYSDSIH